VKTPEESSGKMTRKNVSRVDYENIEAQKPAEDEHLNSRAPGSLKYVFAILLLGLVLVISFYGFPLASSLVKKNVGSKTVSPETKQTTDILREVHAASPVGDVSISSQVDKTAAVSSSDKSSEHSSTSADDSNDVHETAAGELREENTKLNSSLDTKTDILPKTTSSSSDNKDNSLDDSLNEDAPPIYSWPESLDNQEPIEGGILHQLQVYPLEVYKSKTSSHEKNYLPTSDDDEKLASFKKPVVLKSNERFDSKIIDVWTAEERKKPVVKDFKDFKINSIISAKKS